VAVVQRWTGREARALRQALRLSVRGFARYLGVGVRTVAAWDADGQRVVPRPEMQAVLDTALEQAGPAARRRFEAAVMAAATDHPSGGADDVADAVRGPGASPLAYLVEMCSTGAGAHHGSSTRHHRASTADAAAGDGSDLADVLAHIREQWHALVRTDNLLGPRHALAGVRHQLFTLIELMDTVPGSARAAVVLLAAQYAESAAWLYEDSDELVLAQLWTTQAMEWAYEVGDDVMLAWTAYRRSQQALAAGDTTRAVGLAQAARRNEAAMAGPLRAATRVQEACGRAGEGDERAALTLLDDAHCWAADDLVGEARTGPGSFCTPPSYVELRRGDCLLRLGKPRAAITHYEAALPGLPAVYRRDRASGLVGKAAAHAGAGQPEHAATTAQLALPIARQTGSRRTISRISTLGRTLSRHRRLAAVTELLEDLAVEL
jgi:tetratricopeptide (TPR) repeat protein